MSAQAQPAGLADLHRDARYRVIGIAKDLGDEQAVTRVPGTPLWNVHELLSHIVGCPIALVAGELDGAGSEPWTQAQVAARRGATVSDLIAELEGATTAIDAAFLSEALPAPAVFDLLTHEQDLRGAVGAPVTPDAAATRFLIDRFAHQAVTAAAKAGLAPLRLIDPDSGWTAGTAGGVVGEASEFEWSRVLTGRRSNEQARSLTWAGDPGSYLDLLCLFGPLPVTAVHD